MKISVALCSYNGSRFIEEQLLSIANQVLPVDEIIVCDDGSSDNTIEIINHFQETHSNISFKISMNEKNLGVVKNFEKAIRVCSGDIIFLSDQDDVWRKDKTSYLVDYFNKNPRINVVFTDADLIDSSGNLISKYSLLEAIRLLPNMDLWEGGADLEMLNISNRATGATMAFRSSFIDAFLPFTNGGYLHDGQMALIACSYGCLGVIREHLIAYRQHGNNVIGINKDNWIFSSASPRIAISTLVEPIPIQGFLNKISNKRLDFYMNRLKNYSTVFGKIRLLFLIPDYFRYYHRFGWIFLVSDFLYGISFKGRKIMLEKWDRKFQ